MLQVGIVGLPNVGKSTLFKTLTKKQVDCANFPFCTIEPNVGVVEVPDERLYKLAEVSKSQKIIPAAIEFVDIAGLVKGAHKGEGLGNKFLSNIRDVDMSVHVVREFQDKDVHHVEGSVDAARDVETIEIELAMADIETVQKRLESVRKQKMSGGAGSGLQAGKAGKTKELEKELAACEKIFAALESGKMASTVVLDEDEAAAVKSLHLLSNKPILYVLNVGEEHATDSEASSPLFKGGQRGVIISVKIESEIVDLPKEEQKEFLAAMGLEQSGLDRLIVKCFDLLHLMTYFTSGEKETRAWTIPKNTKAPQAAGVIHTDFEKNFIRAEIIFWKDFVELGEVGAREAGKLRVEGKEYVMQDGDVCHFRIGT